MSTNPLRSSRHASAMAGTIGSRPAGSAERPDETRITAPCFGPTDGALFHRAALRHTGAVQMDVEIAPGRFAVRGCEDAALANGRLARGAIGLRECRNCQQAGQRQGDDKRSHDFAPCRLRELEGEEVEVRQPATSPASCAPGPLPAALLGFAIELEADVGIRIRK